MFTAENKIAVHLPPSPQKKSERATFLFLYQKFLFTKYN